MKRFLVLVASCALALAAQEASTDGITPDEALRLLKVGNERFSTAHLAHPHQSVQRRVEISKGQHPFAQILSCSDSRVVPEIIFDEGLGDLFVTRVAGNIVDDAVKGTLEYGAEHLDVRLIVVLGHRDCGAVTAAVQAEEVHDHIIKLMDSIFPAVVATRGQAGDPVDNAVRANVIRSVNLLRNSWPTLHSMSQSGRIRIVGAVYDLKSGAVEWLDD
jgi:carbonic anhydrase